MKYLLLSFLVTSLFSFSALALPLLGPVPVSAGEISLENYNFDGIVALNNCSGSIVKLEGMSDSMEALVLTNGHCTSKGSFNYQGMRFPAHGEVFKNLKVRRKFTLLGPAAQGIGDVYSKKLLYASMTDTDMAIYQLGVSYAELKRKYNVSPLMMSDRAPGAGETIEIISGYWKRGYSCFLEDTIFSLKEGPWVWLDSLRYSDTGCDTIGGTSGSPIISSITREVVGVNNTGNGGREDCSVMHPCEVDEQGNKTVLKNRSYGQQTFNLYECMNDNFKLDLERESCKLPK